VYRLVTINSVEEKILETARFKLNMDDKIIQGGMFNLKSNSESRKKYLMTLLDDETNQTDGDEEEETPSAEALNEMLARSEDELTLFAKMDAEMDARCAQMWQFGARKSRLISEAELPKWMLREDHEVGSWVGVCCVILFWVFLWLWVLCFVFMQSIQFMYMHVVHTSAIPHAQCDTHNVDGSVSAWGGV